MGQLLYSEARQRLGLWLNLEFNPALLTIILSDPRRRILERPHRCVVLSLAEPGYVFLQVWCQAVVNLNPRYTVFTLKVREDPNWVCHADMGIGEGETADPQGFLDLLEAVCLSYVGKHGGDPREVVTLHRYAVTRFTTELLASGASDEEIADRVAGFQTLLGTFT